MKRLIYNRLIEWKNSTNRKPLLLQGARQVGKTYLVNEFGKKEYTDFITLNFEENPGLKTLFAGDLSPQTILENISIYIGKKITSENTLLFFDEIQIVPEVLTSLKYFYEKAPEYHIIAAGSLLGVSIGKPTSFPVGKVNFLSMYPMNFTEFLWALEETFLAEKISTIKKIKPLPDIIHEKIIKLYKQYLFTGGMPEVLQKYIDTKDIALVRHTQNEILEACKRDFSKYNDKTQALKTAEVWQSIPFQLARENKKFKYSDVRKKARASTFESTIEWLKGAGLIHLAYNVTTPKLPLPGYTDYSKFKVYMPDAGLLGAMLNLPSSTIMSPDDIFREYNGAFIENFVAQELTAQGISPLFYWTSKSDAEVDFLLQKENRIYPLEVKSGTSLKLKSLRSYADKYHPDHIFRASSRNFTQSGNFVNIPLYSIYNFMNLIPQPEK
ncbi:MAG TPA: ATP-binding protein [Bacteroidetes bacterium]|nr:ATP-binding protein [Bacteroidota bacterium]